MLVSITSNRKQCTEEFGTAEVDIFTHLGIRKFTEIPAQGFRCTLQQVHRLLFENIKLKALLQL